MAAWRRVRARRPKAIWSASWAAAAAAGAAWASCAAARRGGAQFGAFAGAASAQPGGAGRRPQRSDSAFFGGGCAVAASEREPWRGIWDALRGLVGGGEEAQSEAEALPAALALPCGTVVGSGLLRELQAEGEDAFLLALQAQLTALRQSSGQKVAGKFRENAGETGSLQYRIAELKTKELRQQILADLLHLGTVQRLRAEGLELTAPPLLRAESASFPEEAINVTATVTECLRSMPLEVAAEVRGYVLAATPAGAGAAGGEPLRARPAELAPLLVGGSLFGYFLALLLQRGGGTGGAGSLSEAAEAERPEWRTDAAFATVSTRVGRLVGLEPETDDPLRQYESLREVAVEVRWRPRSEASATEEGARGPGSGPAAALLPLSLEGLRGLLAEACAMGFALRLWEAKVAKFVCPEDPA